MRDLDSGSCSGEGEKRMNSAFILGIKRTSGWKAKLEGSRWG